MWNSLIKRTNTCCLVCTRMNFSTQTWSALLFSFFLLWKIQQWWSESFRSEQIKTYLSCRRYVFIARYNKTVKTRTKYQKSYMTLDIYVSQIYHLWNINTKSVKQTPSATLNFFTETTTAKNLQNKHNIFNKNYYKGEMFHPCSAIALFHHFLFKFINQQNSKQLH